MSSLFRLLIILSLQILLTSKQAASAPVACVTESLPNPIFTIYPDKITGTLNGTTAIIPIPYEAARRIVPAKYGLLRKAARSLVPGLPPDRFPAILEFVLDHAIQQDGIKIPDFLRASIKIPFVDRLNDGYTSFRYIPSILVTESFVDLAGNVFFGNLYKGSFEPSCNPYKINSDGLRTSKAYLVSTNSSSAPKPAFDIAFRDISWSPYDINIFKNLTNQPWFGDVETLCDHFSVLFNSSVTTREYAPIPVVGSVTVAKPFYIEDTTFPLVYGYRMDNAFIEIVNVTCDSLKGYDGTGPGD